MGPRPPVAMMTSARSIAWRNDGDARLQFVADGRVVEYADAQLLQPLAEPLGVGVEKSAAGDLVADGEDFGDHWLSVAHPVHLLDQIADLFVDFHTGADDDGPLLLPVVDGARARR